MSATRPVRVKCVSGKCRVGRHGWSMGSRMRPWHGKRLSENVHLPCPSCGGKVEQI